MYCWFYHITAISILLNLYYIFHVMRNKDDQIEYWKKKFVDEVIKNRPKTLEV